ncbi:MAG: hypothetical protein V1866_06420 [archaeon]
MKEFWNSLLTEKSWLLLHEIVKKYDFILIGGWAVYLLTKQQKSKDIDIVVDISELDKLKKEGLIKNDRLKKYELKKEEIDVDIYVAYYSEIAIPAEEISKYIINVEGFKIPRPEAMIVLKQMAYTSREASVKGQKDRIDILSLVFFTGFNAEAYRQIIAKHNHQGYLAQLRKIIKGFKEYDALNMTPRELKLKKEAILKKLG